MRARWSRAVSIAAVSALVSALVGAEVGLTAGAHASATHASVLARDTRAQQSAHEAATTAG